MQFQCNLSSSYLRQLYLLPCRWTLPRKYHSKSSKNMLIHSALTLEGKIISPPEVALLKMLFMQTNIKKISVNPWARCSTYTIILSGRCGQGWGKGRTPYPLCFGMWWGTDALYFRRGKNSGSVKNNREKKIRCLDKGKVKERKASRALCVFVSRYPCIAQYLLCSLLFLEEWVWLPLHSCHAISVGG